MSRSYGCTEQLLRFLQRLFQKLLSFEMPNISHISIFLFPLLYSFDAEVYDVGVKYSTFAKTLSKLSNLDYYKYTYSILLLEISEMSCTCAYVSLLEFYSVVPVLYFCCQNNFSLRTFPNAGWDQIVR